MSDVGPEHSGRRQAKGVALDVKFNTQNLGLKVGAVAHRDPPPTLRPVMLDLRSKYQMLSPQRTGCGLEKKGLTMGGGGN